MRGVIGLACPSRHRLRQGTGESTADDLVLEEKLKKATGVSVAELAHFAERWPDV